MRLTPPSCAVWSITRQLHHSPSILFSSFLALSCESWPVESCCILSFPWPSSTVSSSQVSRTRPSRRRHQPSERPAAALGHRVGCARLACRRLSLCLAPCASQLQYHAPRITPYRIPLPRQPCRLIFLVLSSSLLESRSFSLGLLFYPNNPRAQSPRSALLNRYLALPRICP